MNKLRWKDIGIDRDRMSRGALAAPSNKTYCFSLRFLVLLRESIILRVVEGNCDGKDINYGNSFLGEENISGGEVLVRSEIIILSNLDILLYELTI